ncbi:MAG: hypothetical protein NG737_04945 [Omnitrophica bacterium]|nr:hypothetical protein [Candidatus Omnitrophota bacterium]
MLKVIILCILLIFCSCKTESSRLGFSVDGIMYDKKNPRAIVEGEILGVGDYIYGAKIIDITRGYVKFEYNNEIFVEELVVSEKDVLKSEKAARRKAKFRKKNSPTMKR